MPTIEVSEVDPASAAARAMFFCAVDELNRRYGGDGDDGHAPVREMTRPRGFFLVARVETGLAGGVGLRSIGPRRDRLAEVKRLWVRPDLRRAGVGSALMDRLTEEARTAGFTRIYLETGPAQPEAQALYARLGWTRVDSFPRGVHTYPDALRFARDLVS